MAGLLEGLSTNTLREALRLLKRAQLILGSAGQWCQHDWAVDAAGNAVSPSDATATRFCVAGAVMRAEHELHGTPFQVIAEELQEPISGPKSVLSALAALSLPMMRVYWAVYEETVAEARREREADIAAGKAPEKREPVQCPAALIAAALNDDQRIEWPHIAVALEIAVIDVAGELARRRATSPGGRREE
jgi:hypothetical protein